MGFFEDHKKHIIIFAAIILVAVSLATTGKKLNATFFDNIVSVVVTPFQGITTSISSWFGDKISAISTGANAAEENVQLKKELEDLKKEGEVRERRISLLEQDNEKLSSLLEIAQKYAEYSTTGVQIIAKDPGNWYDIFVINKGKREGLSANMVLLGSGGLIGKITEAGELYSKAQSILDSRSSISAISQRTGDQGVVRGDYTLMNDGLCKMEYIDAEAEIMEGDEIVTSYLSDIYPPGIPIGYVKEIRNDSNGLTKYAIIQPVVDFKHLDTILVINELYVNTNTDAEE